MPRLVIYSVSWLFTFWSALSSGDQICYPHQFAFSSVRFLRECDNKCCLTSLPCPWASLGRPDHSSIRTPYKPKQISLCCIWLLLPTQVTLALSAAICVLLQRPQSLQRDTNNTREGKKLSLCPYTGPLLYYICFSDLVCNTILIKLYIKELQRRLCCYLLALYCKMYLQIGFRI